MNIKTILAHVQDSLPYFQSRDANNSVVLFESIGSGIGAFVLVFFASEAGQRFSDAFRQLENVANRLNWYHFPNKVQRILPLVIFNVQQPIEIQFFGSAVCGREQFKKVSAYTTVSWDNF